MDVSILIVNWNSKDFLGPCLRSIERHAAGTGHEVLVIDSGSFDGCGELLAASFPRVRFIQSPANLGFAGANNEAVRQARGSRLLFLNPDTELESQAVSAMVEHLERSPDAGAVGCRLLNGDGSIQACCVQSFPTILGQLLNSELLMRLFPRWSLWGMPTLLEPGRDPARVDVVSGACLMVRRSDFERVGGFSEDYFMYAEDVDLCHKLRQAGFVNYYLPQVTVRHYGGGCTDKAPSEFAVVMMRDSIWRFLRKSRGPTYAIAYRASIAGAALGRLALLAALALAGRLLRRPASSGHGAGSIDKWRALLAWSLGLRQATRPA